MECGEGNVPLRFTHLSASLACRRQGSCRRSAVHGTMTEQLNTASEARRTMITGEGLDTSLQIEQASHLCMEMDGEITRSVEDFSTVYEGTAKETVSTIRLHKYNLINPALHMDSSSLCHCSTYIYTEGAVCSSVEWLSIKEWEKPYFFLCAG